MKSFRTKYLTYINALDAANVTTLRERADNIFVEGYNEAAGPTLVNLATNKVGNDQWMYQATNRWT